jgi:hypothetical protein
VTNSQIISVLLALLILPLSAGAHHSFSAEFDTEKHMTVTGIVSTVEWMNPHVWVFLDAKDPVSGKMKRWALQLPSPNMLYRQGWTREPFKSGLVVTANVFAAKDSSTKGMVQEISSAGRMLFASDRHQK